MKGPLGRPLLALTLGHLTVDFYVGLIPFVYPLLVDRFSLSLSTVGLLSLAYAGGSSLSQPLFGWVADRRGPGVLRFALPWTALAFGAAGFAPSFGALLALAAAAGLGSGAYHPFGAVNVGALAPPGRRNSATSLYVTGGYAGVTLAPLAGAALFPAFGIGGFTLAALPGLAAAVWLLREFARLHGPGPEGTGDAETASGAPDEAAPDEAAPEQGQGARDARRTAAALSLAAVVGVTMSRNWNLFAVEAFVPSWYDSLGYGPSFYGPLASVILAAATLGAVASGPVADRLGKRAVVAATLALSVPALAAFAAFPGPLAFLTGALVGFSCAAAGPLMLVAAQQLVEGRGGLASGVVLGLGFVTGAVGAPVTGMLADAFGLGPAMLSQAAIAAATIPLAFLLPREERAAG